MTLLIQNNSRRYTFDSLAKLRLLSGQKLRDNETVDLSGHTTEGDSGGGPFFWDASSTATDDNGTVAKLADTTIGRFRRSDVSRITAAMFGANGSGDDTAAIQAAATYASGGSLAFSFGKTYLHTGNILFNDVFLDCNNCTFDFTHTGNKAGLQLKGKSSAVNANFINNGTPSGTLGAAGQRDLVALDVYDCEFRNLKFLSGTNDHAPFNILGNSRNIKVSNIEYEDGDWDMGLIIHWATVDDSAATDFSDDIDFLPSVSNDTTHPHNINISNVKCGDFTIAGALVSGVFLSGVYNVFVDDVECGEIARAMTISAGDYGSDFSTTEEGSKLMSCITAFNVQAYQITGTEGIIIDGKGALTSNVVPVRAEITNPRLRSTTAGTRYGVFIRGAGLSTVKGGHIVGFSRSIFCQRFCTGVRIRGVECTEASDGGILIDTDTGTNENITITGCFIFNNNTDISAGGNFSGIVFKNCNGGLVHGNTFGRRGATENQVFAVYLFDSSDNITVANNVVEEAAGTIAFSNELVTQYTRNFWDGGGNSSIATTFTTDPAGHVWYRDLGLGRRSAMINTADTLPTTGTWGQGDEVIFRFSTAGGHRGGSFTDIGWKRFGQIDA